MGAKLQKSKVDNKEEVEEKPNNRAHSKSRRFVLKKNENQKVVIKEKVQIPSPTVSTFRRSVRKKNEIQKRSLKKLEVRLQDLKSSHMKEYLSFLKREASSQIVKVKLERVETNKNENKAKKDDRNDSSAPILQPSTSGHRMAIPRQTHWVNFSSAVPIVRLTPVPLSEVPNQATPMSTHPNQAVPVSTVPNEALPIPIVRKPALPYKELFKSIQAFSSASTRLKGLEKCYKLMETVLRRVERKHAQERLQNGKNLDGAEAKKMKRKGCPASAIKPLDRRTYRTMIQHLQFIAKISLKFEDLMPNLVNVGYMMIIMVKEARKSIPSSNAATRPISI